jgi:hypothetical protein
MARTISRKKAEVIADDLQAVRNMIANLVCTTNNSHMPGDGNCNACDAWKKLDLTIELFKNTMF